MVTPPPIKTMAAIITKIITRLFFFGVAVTGATAGVSVAVGDELVIGAGSETGGVLGGTNGAGSTGGVGVVGVGWFGSSGIIVCPSIIRLFYSSSVSQLCLECIEEGLLCL